MATKITRIVLHPLSIPLPQPFRIALGEVSATSGALVRLFTDDGLEGQGEAAPISQVNGEDTRTCLESGRRIAPMLLGKDPRPVAARMEEIEAALPDRNAVRAAFDMALWDLAARSAGVPLHVLLGGDGREIETDRTIGIGPLDWMLREAVTLRDQGFSAIKVKVGDEGFEAELEKIAAIRRVVGPAVRLRIDANQGWDVPRAIRSIRAMAEHDLELVEQPVAREDFAGLAEIRRAVTVPIMADESCFSPEDALRLVRMDAVDALNIKLMKCGGIVSASRIAAIARAAGLPCMMGCMVETRLAIAAALHFASANPVVAFADLDGHVDFASDPTVGGFSEDGALLRPGPEPGLGVRFRAEELAGLQASTFG